MNRAGDTVEPHALRRAFVFNRRLLTRKVNGGMRKIAHYAMIMQRFSPNSNQPTAVSRFMARRVARPPKAAFVTRLRSGQLPNPTARQLPDLSTTIWVEPSSTGDTRHRGALNGDSYRLATSKKVQRRPAQGQSQNTKTPNEGDLTTKT